MSAATRAPLTPDAIPTAILAGKAVFTLLNTATGFSAGASE